MSQTTRLVVLAGGIGTLLGAGVVWLAASTGKPAHAPPEATDVVSTVRAERVQAAVAPFLGAAALRAAVREEVRAAIADEAAAARKEVKPQPEEVEPPAPSASYQTAKTHVTERLAQGTWSDVDRERMRAVLGEMSDSERDEVMRQVIVAVNKDQVRVDLDGPLF